MWATNRILVKGVLLQLILAIGGCSESNFAGASAKSGTKPKPNDKSMVATGTLSFSFDIIAGAKTLNLSAKFA